MYSFILICTVCNVVKIRQPKERFIMESHHRMIRLRFRIILDNSYKVENQKLSLFSAPKGSENVDKVVYDHHMKIAR